MNRVVVWALALAGCSSGSDAFHAAQGCLGEDLAFVDGCTWRDVASCADHFGETAGVCGSGGTRSISSCPTAGAVADCVFMHWPCRTHAIRYWFYPPWTLSLATSYCRGDATTKAVLTAH